MIQVQNETYFVETTHSSGGHENGLISSSVYYKSVILFIIGIKSNPGAPIGTSQNPIQLFQEGSTLRSLHPLTNTQVTQIAKALKEKTQTEIPSAVVCENGPNSTR